ncbi:hypothetical protein HDU82_005230 [Entophlyctis luteolus]|nr:hypothetical protein HDU82_005230 [Entophlyctis luteolus]KAJ3385345.1 hypothetical protein HDU84_002292 [Entophlyctis sp. JEL0112]
MASNSTSSTTSQTESTTFRIAGISLALASAAFIGASYIIKKKGLLDANAVDGKRPGTSHGYLKSAMWWTGMTMMLVGELCNVAAYAFQPAIIVTPLGAISVVISAVLSDFFLKEKLNLSGKIGCAQCVLGATLLVVNSPPGSATDSLTSFWVKVWDWGFMSYLVVNILVLAYLMLYAAGRWGEKTPMIYIGICSIVGSYVVVVLQVVGSAIVYSVQNPENSQGKDWTLYLLIAFVVCCGVTQINYLNKALNIFSTAIVTPIYFVCFTTATLVCSAVLFRDFAFSSYVQLVSALVGFLVIVGGVALLFAYNAKLASRANSLENNGSGPHHHGKLRLKSHDSNSSVLSDIDSGAHTDSAASSPSLPPTSLMTLSQYQQQQAQLHAQYAQQQYGISVQQLQQPLSPQSPYGGIGGDGISPASSGIGLNRLRPPAPPQRAYWSAGTTTTTAPTSVAGGAGAAGDDAILVGGVKGGMGGLRGAINARHGQPIGGQVIGATYQQQQHYQSYKGMVGSGEDRDSRLLENAGPAGGWDGI